VVAAKQGMRLVVQRMGSNGGQSRRRVCVDSGSAVHDHFARTLVPKPAAAALHAPGTHSGGLPKELKTGYSSPSPVPDMPGVPERRLHLLCLVFHWLECM